jgi:phosphoribosylanthranilate isomerase
MSVIVKICGITNLPDALAAVEAGANALGFVFWERSPRSVDVATAAAIVRELPAHIVKVGVFVDAPVEQVSTAARACSLNLLQFHGNESPADCLRFGVMSMKAFRVRDAESLGEVRSFATDAWLLDAYAPGQPGGTGACFNWALAQEVSRWGRPIFLAGGLTPENVAEAVRQVEPYGVDVSSGVEVSPGRKDHSRLVAFVRAARLTVG